jgi:hypothetical protein
VAVCAASDANKAAAEEKTFIAMIRCSENLQVDHEMLGEGVAETVARSAESRERERERVA